jgi:hypothetical protein
LRPDVSDITGRKIPARPTKPRASRIDLGGVRAERKSGAAAGLTGELPDFGAR